MKFILILILCFLNSQNIIVKNNEYMSSNEHYYDLKISKTDLEDSPIEGSTFQLYKNNKIIRNEIKTDKNGYAFISSLSNGTYLLKETTKLSWFENSLDRIIIVNNSNKDIIIKSKHIKPANINIITKDSMNNVLNESSFNIYKNGELVGENNTSGLLPGTYTVKQVQVKDSYKIDKKEYILNLKEGENKVLEIKNYKKYLNINTSLLLFIISFSLIIKKILF